MGVSRRGQSEVIGIVLLVGVVTVLVVGAGAIVFADLLQSNEETLATIESNVTAQNITLEVRGGDSVSVSDVELIVRGTSEYRLGLDTDFTQTRGRDSTLFEPGDRWRGSNPLDDGELTLLVLDTETGTLLHEDTYEIG